MSTSGKPDKGTVGTPKSHATGLQLLPISHKFNFSQNWDPATSANDDFLEESRSSPYVTSRSTTAQLPATNRGDTDAKENAAYESCETTVAEGPTKGLMEEFTKERTNVMDVPDHRSYQEVYKIDNAAGQCPERSSEAGLLQNERHLCTDYKSHGYSGLHGLHTETEDTANCEVRHKLSTSQRVSSRSKTFTEKGLSYNIDMSVKRFKSALSAHKRKETMYKDLLNSKHTGISELLQARTDLEECMMEVSASYHKAADLCPDLYNEFMIDILKCQDQNRSLLFSITKSIQTLENELQSQVSKRSKSSMGSSVSKSHKSKQNMHGGSTANSRASSGHSSKSSIKAAAAANAAVLRTKLKYLEAEAAQKVELDKLQMMRDLEIEEAKLSAVQEIESNHSKQASCISRQSTSSIKGSVIHHDTTSQKFDYRIDHAVHVKSGSGDVCSQFAGLNVDNGVIDNGVVVINKGVDVSCVGDSCVVDQTELGVSDSETVVKGTHVKQHNTTMVNKNQGLNFNAPAFVPSNNVKLSTKNQQSDHCVRHQVKYGGQIDQTPLINDHHLHHYVKHGVKQRGLVDQTALINNHHLDHCVTHRSKHRETVDETQLINNHPLDNCVGNTVEQRDPVDQTTLISNQPELCVGQRVKFSDSVNQTKTLPHYVTERNGSVSTASEHDISNISESNSSVSMALLIQSINHLANINRLPTPVPEIFEGDPLKYPAWKAAFQALIGGREIAPLEKIHYLKDYLGGKAKRCVEGFLLSPSAESYDAAMALIEKRYGDPFTIANAFKTKIENWQKISPKDHQGLRQFADFLRQCEVASHTNPSLNVLNDDVHNRTMLDKLPDWLVSRWARQVHRFRENYQCYPSFSEFVSFLVRESDIACDPVARLTGPQEKKTSSLSSKSFNIVATKLKCVFCSKENHMIENCFKLKEKTMEDRKAFIREKRLCFGCLKPGHSSLSCKRRLKCSECNKQHPTPLHGDVKPKPDSSNLSSNNSSQPNATKPAVVTQKKESGKSSKSHVSLMTNYGSYSKSTMIVPVWISSKDSKEEMLVYALLDTQSDTSFVSKATFSQLGISATDTKLSLSTMTSERRVIQSKRVEGLIVRGYNSDVEIQLPTVYLHDSIPASRDNIPTPEMTDAWPHLKSMSQHLLPKGDYDIGLLIGYNCPQALAPRDVIAGQGNSPFAQRTDLGWGIIGLLQSEDDSAHVFSTQTGSYIALRTSANEILPEISSESPPFLGNQYSQDDLKFVNMMMKGIHKTDDGHYQLPLPIRDIHHMPQNNKMVALQRLKGLAKRFDRDPQHFQFYKAFMKDIFESKYAEEVPPSEHDKPSFYLPHHGVYNPSKPGKVRVVMDASAKFKGLSLNECLLLSSDLLNGLIGILWRFRQEHVAFSGGQVNEKC